MSTTSAPTLIASVQSSPSPVSSTPSTPATSATYRGERGAVHCSQCRLPLEYDHVAWCRGQTDGYTCRCCKLKATPPTPPSSPPPPVVDTPSQTSLEVWIQRTVTTSEDEADLTQKEDHVWAEVTTGAAAVGGRAPEHQEEGEEEKTTRRTKVPGSRRKNKKCKRCYYCSASDHLVAKCPWKTTDDGLGGSSWNTDTTKAEEEVMVLSERIALLWKQEWATEEKKTEQCRRCGDWGYGGFSRRHVCAPTNKELSWEGYEEVDADVYQGRD